MKLWGIVKLGLVLMIYAAAACVGLAFVYAGTQATIEKRTQADLETALKELFPGADGFEAITAAAPGGVIVSADPGVSFEGEYAIKRGGKLVGAALRASGGSYGGPIKVLVGVNAGGTISRIKIMEHADTPGLGANAGKANYYVDKASGLTFYGQFSGKSVLDPFEPKDDIIAITAATITSRAVSRVVKAAGTAAFQWLAINGGEAAGGADQ
ncbi:MAG: FMN-binding protein [Treponema sp.]|jgi:electron transport complex protein RnfG|nr:FMN-binding protein [Treponema sp.]